MTSDPAAQPAPQEGAPPEVAESPFAWKAEVAKKAEKQDRWTLKLPGNILNDRYRAAYEKEHKKEPDENWQPPELPDYVKVTATRQGKRAKHSILQPDPQEGGDELFATVARSAFGKHVISISFVPARQWQYRLARLRTAPNILMTAAILLGCASAAATGFLTLIGGITPSGQPVSGGYVFLSWAVIIVAAAAPILAWVSTFWFS